MEIFNPYFQPIMILAGRLTVLTWFLVVCLFKLTKNHN